MNQWMNAVAVTDLAPGKHVVIDIDDVSVALFNINGEFYAIEDLCTHDGSEIASGCVIGVEIECPRHGARFCIKTGEVMTPPAYEPIDTFPTRVINGMVQVCDPRWD